MIPRTVTTVEEVRKTYSFTVKEIESLIRTEGLLCYDIRTKKFLVCLPTLDGFVYYNPDEYPVSSTNLNSYNIEIGPAFIKISSQAPILPCSILAKDFRGIFSEYIDLSDEIVMLLSDRITAPVFVGHANIIKRLAHDYEGSTEIITLNDFYTKKRDGEYYVR